MSIEILLMFHTLFVSFHCVCSNHAFTNRTLDFDILFLVQFFLFFFIVFFGTTALICLCVSLCIVVLLLNRFYAAYTHLCNRSTVERLYI